MNTRADRLWLLGGALLTVLVSAAAYFFAISPVLSDASSLRGDRDSTQTQNAVLAQQTRRLADLGAKKAELQAAVAAAEQALPTDSGLPEFTRQLTAAAAAAGVTVTAIGAGTPAKVTNPAASAPAPSSSAPSSATSPSRPAASSGVYSIAVTIAVTGPVAHELAFLADLQKPGKRAALVTSANLASGSTAGGPTLTLQMLVFVVPAA